jgi:signal transduction histidine kinase
MPIGPISAIDLRLLVLSSIEEELSMPTSIWGGPESDDADETYPLSLLKYFLRQMILQFGAQGACIALSDETVGQMRIQAHVRLSNASVPAPTIPMHRLNHDSSGVRRQNRRITINLLHNSNSSVLARSEKAQPVSVVPQTGEIEDVLPELCQLFPVGTCYSRGQGLIGHIWHRNEACALSHDDYLACFHANHMSSLLIDRTPTAYLAVPIREVPLIEEVHRHRSGPKVLGVVVLYQFASNEADFNRQSAQVLQYTELIALYIQNHYLQSSQRRTAEYLQLLKGISAVFPSSVQLVDLVKSVHQFTVHVVNVWSMLLTIYDRDLNRLYDVFAIRDGQCIEGLTERPLVRLKEERPVWWRVIQHEKGALSFSPAHDPRKAQEYQELLTGVCGDQRQAESFLLLPMKMFSRVVGALSITSNRPNAYRPEEIQVLETMAQIVAVNIENARLYERDRQILQEANQRESDLAEINSTLQSISSVLNVTQLLNNLVESVAEMVKAELCIFLQLGASGDVLKAQALYAPSSVQMFDDDTGMPELIPPRKDEPDQLITQIELPFKDTLRKRMDVGFFYLNPPELEELAQGSNEAGAIFLRETGIHSMLVIPMNYQTEFLGFLGVSVRSNGPFRPKEVGTLLAISTQAASAIRNAQLFAQREEAYAELERMSKLKDEFLVTASHELRTPLTAIHGYAGRLKRQASRATPQQILRFATQISVAAQQLSDLVSNMTEAAQIGVIDKNLDLHLEPVQLYAAAEIATTMLSLKDGHEVVLDIAQDLWITGDAPRVRQMLTNLLDNAVKYSLPQTTITVSAHRMMLSEVEQYLSEDQVDHALLVEKGDSEVVLVRVTDQGPGVMAEDQLLIFEKFVRAPRSLTTPVRGSGLGLYISRRFAEAMDGKLWLEKSAPNEGATFSFYLPSVDAPVEVTIGMDD